MAEGPPSHPVERLSSRVQREEGMISISFFLRGKKKVHFASENEAPVAPQKGLCLIPPGECLPCTVRGVTDHAFSPGVVYLAKRANHIYN